MRQPLPRARTLHARGLAAMDHGRPQLASRELSSALRLAETATDADDHAFVVARVLITLANAEFELSGLESALARLASAAEVVDKYELEPLRVLIHGQRALLLLRSGRVAESVSEFDSASEFFRDAAPDDRCKVLLNRAVANVESGALAAARADLRRCAEEAARAELSLFQVKATHNLGYVEFLVGHLPRALQLMDEAFRMDPTLSPGIALLGRARVLVEAGLVREADDVLDEAAAIFRRDRLAQDLAQTELDRARCALISGDVPTARRLAARARDRFRRRGSDSWRRSAELVLLQGDLAAGRPGSRLVAPALRVRAELADEGRTAAARTAGLLAAEAQLAAGDHAGAAATMADLGAISRGDPITTRLQWRGVQARLSAAQGDAARAARRVWAALTELADYQASFGSIDLQTASAIHGRRLAELGLQLALDGRRPADVFGAAERARAVSSRLPAVRPPGDPLTADLLSELRRTVESLSATMYDTVASAPLLRRRRELERAITARRWTVDGSGATIKVARLDEVRAAVRSADAAMVVFAVASGDLHAVIVDGGRAQLRHLGDASAVYEDVRRARADLDVLAQPRLPDALATAVRASFERSAAELDRMLLGPLGIGGRRLVVISTGVLGQLPWGTLPSLRGVPVVVAPSATAWLAAHQRPRRPGRRQVVAVAGPDLARADHEVAGVAKAWAGAPTHIGAAADRDTLAHAMAHGTLVHVAAHGTHQTENPLFSSLRLADGPMFAHELDQTARTPEHVVLSACELGLATVRPGDEALGLTSVLLHLGTPSVVASVARVGDELAAETMIDYHSRLAAGADSAAALASATEHSRAPFVSFGASWRKVGRSSG